MLLGSKRKTKEAQKTTSSCYFLSNTPKGAVQLLPVCKYSIFSVVLLFLTPAEEKQHAAPLWRLVRVNAALCSLSLGWLVLAKSWRQQWHHWCGHTKHLILDAVFCSCGFWIRSGKRTGLSLRIWVEILKTKWLGWLNPALVHCQPICGSPAPGPTLQRGLPIPLFLVFCPLPYMCARKTAAWIGRLIEHLL